MAQLWKEVAFSFYSGTFYGELARTGKGFGMRLIVALSLIMAILLCAGILLTDTKLRGAVRQIPKLAATLPEVTVKDGTLSINKPVPYRISLDNDSTGPGVVIDTNYKINDGISRYMQENNIVALFTADKVIISKEQKNEQDIYDLKDSKPFAITHQRWIKIGEATEKWGLALLITTLFITVFIGTFIVSIVATLLTAVVILVLSLIAKTEFGFAAAMRLAAAARIPVNVFCALPIFLSRPGLSGASAWILWALYVIFAVCAVKLHSGRTAP